MHDFLIFRGWQLGSFLSFGMVLGGIPLIAQPEQPPSATIADHCDPAEPVLRSEQEHNAQPAERSGPFSDPPAGWSRDRPDYTAKQHLLSYAPIREADVFWSKRVWSCLDFCEAQNEHLQDSPEPLVEVLAEAIAAGRLVAYKESATGECFGQVIGVEEWGQRTGTDSYSTELLQLVEDWTISESDFELKPRIRAIGLVASSSPSLERQNRNMPVIAWVSFDQARPILAQHQAYRSPISQCSGSWDDALVLGQYRASIIKLSNVEDRYLAEDLNSALARLAAEALENRLLEYSDSLYGFPEK